ncbi:hypothetical protein ACP70R_042282 [Stipagrostis hirtigluma subsp. patula]
MVKLFFFAGCFLLILLNVARVESRDAPVEPRKHHGAHKEDRITKILVFGDSFADNGNNRPNDKTLRFATRDWFYPYGITDELHDKKPTGRFSNALVQSDFLAKILGSEQSPPPYMEKGAEEMDDAGMNFAVGGAGVFEVEMHYPTIRDQIQQLQDMINNDLADGRDLQQSVALVAYSQAVDYEQIGYGADMDASNDDDMQTLADFVANVTDEIVSCVGLLQEMGVPKVLVNSLPPLGCRPRMARDSNYSECVAISNQVSDTHNAALKEKLGDDNTVMLLDLNTVFTDIVTPKEGSTLSKFENGLEPCCEIKAAKNFCGEYNALNDDMPEFTTCSDRDGHFYWDQEHPSDAGWRAVMRILQGEIMAFLGISTLNHF